MTRPAAALHAEPMGEALQRAVGDCWAKAQARWSRFLLLSAPLDAPGEHVAMIDLRSRQIYLDGRSILSRGLEGCLEALLAHEIGHHVRYPGSLVTSARLRLMEKALIPLEGYSVVNLFCDLLINVELGAELQPQIVQIYRSFQQAGWEQDPAFCFYLSIYEELWQLEPNHLLGVAGAAFEKRFPGARADAQMVAQNLFNLGPNVFTQFLYFVSITSRYVQPPGREVPMGADPYQCGCGEPSPEDWAEALHPGAREKEAVDRALAERWIDRDEADRLMGPLSLERRIQGLPGQDTADAEAVPEVMAAYYRLQAERFLFHPPPRQVLGEAVVPTTLEEWEAGDPLPSVDWIATLQLRGERLGGAMPLRRERIADYEGQEVPWWQPRVEIYLDVSGSMPDPRRTLNALTLAAQILCVGAIRAGGWVRALLYSGDTVAYWTWCRSEVEMSRFLMHYIGGGTAFPFQKLEESVGSCAGAQPTRVVITDQDFDRNFEADPRNAGIFSRAAEGSSPLVLLLHRCAPRRVAYYRSKGAQVAEVHELEDFPSVAAALANALFQERRHGVL